MSDIKTLKSVDIASYTTIVTGIEVIFSIILSVLLIIATGIISSKSIGIVAYIIPTIIVGTLMRSIYHRFMEGYLYNLLTKKLNPITFELKDGKEITKISTVPTALIVAVISTIFAIILMAIGMFVIPLILSAIIQILMFSELTAIAYLLYQVSMILMHPAILAMIIIGSFIVTFVFTLIATYIYNFLGSKGRGVVIDLSDNTTLNSIEPVSLIIALTAVSLIFNIIFAVITLISGGDATQALSNIIAGVIGGVVGGGLTAIFYNFLAPKLGELKVELIDN